MKRNYYQPNVYAATVRYRCDPMVRLGRSITKSFVECAQKMGEALALTLAPLNAWANRYRIERAKRRSDRYHARRYHRSAYDRR